MTREKLISLLPVYTGTYQQTIKHGFQSPTNNRDILAYKQASNIIVRSRSGGYAYPISIADQDAILSK